MVYTVYIKNLDVNVRIGVHDFEKSASQRVLVSVGIRVDIALPGDTIGKVFDYDPVADHIRTLAVAEHVDLQETVCLRVLEFCKARDHVVGVAVRTCKPDVYPDAEAVGCVMSWGDAEGLAIY